MTPFDNQTTLETFTERTLGFTIPSREARGRLVRLNPSIDAILSAHDYPPPVANMLAEALVLTVLMGSLLKDDGSQMTMQADDRPWACVASSASSSIFAIAAAESG